MPAVVTTDRQDLVERFFTSTGASYDRVVRWTTLGLDARWKRRMLALVPPLGGRGEAAAILDLACGTGILTKALLDAHPAARVVGVDVTEGYLAVARERLAAHGDRVDLRLGDATTAPIADAGPYDAIVGSYLPKYVDAERLLEHAHPALKPGGMVVLHDFSVPSPAPARWVWSAWFGVLHVVAPRLHPEWRETFDGSLYELVRTSRWVEETLAALARRGYEEARAERLTFGAATIVHARRPG